MKSPKKYLVDIHIDKLTNSIENVISGDSFKTEVLPITSKDLKYITKKNGWRFNWSAEFKSQDRAVYKLVIRDNENIVQGLISLTPTEDNVFMHLIESTHLTLGKTNFIMEFLETLLLLHADNPSQGELMVTFPFGQRLN